MEELTQKTIAYMKERHTTDYKKWHKSWKLLNILKRADYLILK